MDQRIGTSSKPLEGAGFDPAFIPGLTPVTGGPQAGAAQDAATQDGDASPAREEERPAQDTGSLTGPSEAADPGDADEEDAEVPVEGPVFEAADRRARIVADARGVRLSLDEEACEFGWDEIGAVETATARFGKRYTVVVHTTDRRWWPIEIDADSRARFAEWDARLDAVLDAFFDDGSDTRDAAKGGSGGEDRTGAGGGKDREGGTGGRTVAESGGGKGKRTAAEDASRESGDDGDVDDDRGSADGGTSRDAASGAGASSRVSSGGAAGASSGESSGDSAGPDAGGSSGSSSGADSSGSVD